MQQITAKIQNALVLGLIRGSVTLLVQNITKKKLHGN